MDAEAKDTALSAEDQEFFHREGYLMLPGFLEADYNERLKNDVDKLMQNRQAKDERFLVSYKEMGLLTSHPPLVEKLAALMGPRFAMHHIHAVRQDAGNRGVNWHQDYEQYPQTNRSHIMVHVFYYLDGLNGEIGDLFVLPRSQNMVIANGGLGLFGTEALPGSLCIDKVPPGTAIIVHSGVWHARRAKAGGEDRSRYFIDISYCQHGVLWPGYREEIQKEINRTALETGCGRDGCYDFLYDTTQFFNHRALSEKFRAINEGSTVLQMKGMLDDE
jgi:hypothetical protein